MHLDSIESQLTNEEKSVLLEAELRMLENQKGYTLEELVLLDMRIANTKAELAGAVVAKNCDTGGRYEHRL